MKKETKDIPIIILSNLSQESDVKRGLELGAVDYLIKSEVSLSEVVKRVKESILKLNK
jgi:DNA-binding response OmpR family regulator